MNDRSVRAEDHLERGSALALFIDDNELRRRMNPQMGRDRFRAAVRAAEQRGLPKIHPLWRGRYWPAVRAWLDGENGVGSSSLGSGLEDGPENFDATPRQNPRPQAQPLRPALLDRTPGGTRPDGLPRQVHPPAP